MNNEKFRMKIGLLVLLAALPLAGGAANRPISQKWDVRNGPGRRAPMQWFAGESVDLSLQPVVGRTAFEFGDAVPILTVLDWTGTNAYMAATGTVSNARANWSLTAEQCNLPEGSYNAYAAAVQGAEQTVLAWMTLKVRWSPTSANIDPVDPWPLVYQVAGGSGGSSLFTIGLDGALIPNGTGTGDDVMTLNTDGSITPNL